MKNKYWVLLSIFLAFSSAIAKDSSPGWEMPIGHWDEKKDSANIDDNFSLDILPGHKIKITVIDTKSSIDWGPSIIEGRYRLTATKNASYHVDVNILSQKPLYKWPLLGADIKIGNTYNFTFGFDCSDGKNSVMVCLHGKEKVHCQDLEREDSSCRGKPPAINGSLINPPPDRIK